MTPFEANRISALKNKSPDEGGTLVPHYGLFIWKGDLMNRPKGTKDIFGSRQATRTMVKNHLRTVSEIYNFTEIETPIFERKEVYSRAVGETSDIVSKEMYEFKDKKGRNMVLRPEGTAGVIRAIVENKLYVQLPLKKYYMGPMFRYENPQKGRQRQFTQFGVEYLAEKSPFIDAEVIMMADMILKTLGLNTELKLNSLGDKQTRTSYSKALKTYFEKHKENLTTDSINRIDKNPMRILDDKVDGKKDFVLNAPKISDFYSKETKEYFDTLTAFLASMDIEFTVDERLVRGLDYYTDTAFEFVSLADSAGAQSTIIGGGRYENLVSQFGGPEVSGIGFGLGLERLVNDVEAQLEEPISQAPDVFVLNIAEDAQESVAGLVYMLRSAGVATEWNSKPSKLKKAFVKADRSGAHYNIIAGAKELASGQVVVKHHGVQDTVELTELIEYLRSHGGHKHEEN